MTILRDKRLLITGVVTTDSIAWATAASAIRQGAEVVLTAPGRDLDRAVEAAGALPGGAEGVEVVEVDLTSPDHVERLMDRLERTWHRLDGALHAVAFAPREALAGEFLAAGPAATSQAFLTSTHTFATLAGVLARLAPARGASLVGLDFDARGAWPVYNWMGVCKAGLEAANRYVARDLGPRGIRSNLVAAGPIHTRAAGGIADFDALTSLWEQRAPMRWDACDASPVADAVCFLLSDLSRMVTGEVLHVDAGYHAMA